MAKKESPSKGKVSRISSTKSAKTPSVSAKAAPAQKKAARKR